MYPIAFYGLALDIFGALLIVLAESNRFERLIKNHYQNRAYPAIFDLFSGKEITPSDEGFQAIFNSIREEEPEPDVNSEYAENIQPEDYVYEYPEKIIGNLSENYYRPFEYYQFDRREYEQLPTPVSIWIKGKQHTATTEEDFTYGFPPDSTVMLDYREPFEEDQREWEGTSLKYCDASEVAESFVGEVKSMAQGFRDRLAFSGALLLLVGFVLQGVQYVC